jgi:hypothetical protein
MYDDYDRDYEDDPEYRALYMPTEEDVMHSILDRIFQIGEYYVPFTVNQLHDTDDIPF